MNLQEIIKARQVVLSVADSIFKDAVVKIVSKKKNQKGFYQGSGVVLEDGKIVTAAHVVTDSVNGVPADEIFVCTDKPEIPKDCLPVTVVNIQLGNKKTDNYVDLALLESEDAKGKPHVSLALKAPKIGEKVTIKGYDGRRPNEESAVGGTVVKRSREYIEIEPGLWQGASGGGAFKNGKLEGVVSKVIVNNNDLTTPLAQKIIPAQMIRYFMKSMLPEQYDPNSEEGKAKIKHIEQYPEVKYLPIIYNTTPPIVPRKTVREILKEKQQERIKAKNK